ncbi:hypothetical protein skT53_35630 [Effusibacillus dendaii]|uniref:Uncharacterized protein n=1 Tax=Effusibacillus dendaii TaxID=2743772 RepID=A0A7I8DEE5_9BACL|nr:hypothetical protein skT53_35630 [Effusibacillus dendaii]
MRDAENLAITNDYMLDNYLLLGYDTGVNRNTQAQEQRGFLRLLG